MIPTFNRAKQVRRAIDSALAQSEKCDVLVVDHGSTDETLEVLISFGDKVTYVRRFDDRGPIFSWLDGVLHSETEFVKLLFDDDLLSPDFVEKAMRLMSDEVGFVASNACVIEDASGNVVDSELFKFPDTGIYKVASLVGERVAQTMISPSSIIMRRADLVSGLYMGLLPFQTQHHHGAGPDHYVKLLAMLRYPRFGIVNETLVSFGFHEGSITVQSQKSATQQQNLQSVYREVWVYYQQLRMIKVMRPLTMTYVRLGSCVGKLLSRIKRPDTS